MFTGEWIASEKSKFRQWRHLGEIRGGGVIAHPKEFSISEKIISIPIETQKCF